MHKVCKFNKYDNVMLWIMKLLKVKKQQKKTTHAVFMELASNNELSLYCQKFMLSFLAL